MGTIFNTKNLRAYVRKYNAGKDFPDWPLEDLVYIRIPALAIRNMDYDEDVGSHKLWPLSWRKKKNSALAISITATLLKEWQAFRPRPSKSFLQRLYRHLPRTLYRFQRQMLKMGVRDIGKPSINGATYKRVLIAIASAAAEVSALKKVNNPMMGSKVLNFLLPEFFPVWDNGWIRKKALMHYRDRRQKVQDVMKALESGKNSEAAKEYASYVHMMAEDLWNTSETEYRQLKHEFIKRAGVPREIIDHHFSDIAPLLFEVCLLGKHC